jgi:diaminopimelate epimerase
MNGNVSIEMGRFSFDPADIPVNGSSPVIDQRIGDLIVTAVNTGVPHAVSFVPDVDAILLNEIAPAIRSADVFPEGTNVSVAEEQSGEFVQRTFERGVEGETVACGTGAVAIVAVAFKNGAVKAGKKVTVRPPGGELQVVIREDETAVLIGPVTKEFSGDLSSSEV